jgi:hypothetical protein
VFVDEGDQRHFTPADVRGQLREIVESFLRRAVQNVVVGERFEAVGFVGQQRGLHSGRRT